MQVKLNAFRGEGRPGDVVDIPDSDAAILIEHGAAFPVDDGDAEAAAEEQAAQVVSGSAALAATSGTDTAAP